MDFLAVRFNVYPADGATSLFATPKRKVDLPAPCINTNEYKWTAITGHKFLGTQASRTHMAISVHGGCTETEFPYDYKETARTFIYSEATDNPSGRVWVNVYNLKMAGIDAIDIDGDTISELVMGLTLVRPDLPDGAQNMRPIAFKDTDGSVVFDVTRGLTR